MPDQNPFDALDEPNPFDALDPASDSANPFDKLEQPSAASATAKRMDAVTTGVDQSLPTVTVQGTKPPRDSTWSDVADDVLPAIGARIETKAAGAQEYFGTGEYNDARKKLWQSIVLPGAVREAKEKDVNLTDMPDVQQAAEHLGVRPDVFTRDWPDYANMSPSELQAVQAKQRERIAAGNASMSTGAARRKTAAQVSADTQPNGSGFSPKSVAFNVATMVPDLLVGGAATVATGGIGGAAAMAASIAPEEYANARNRGLNDRDASTYATLTTLATSVPEIPVLRIVENAPVARQIIGSAVGQKFGATAGGKVLGTAVTQGVTQSVVQALQIGIDKGLLDENMSLPDALKAIAASGITGAVVGAPMGAIHAATTRTRKPTTFQDIPEAGARVEPTISEDLGTTATTESQPGPNAEVSEKSSQVLEPTVKAPEPAPAEAHPATETAAADPGTIHAALKAVQDKTASPPQVDMLEDQGLARRNDVNVPRLLPAGRRKLTELNANPPLPEREAESSHPAVAPSVPEAAISSTDEAPVDRLRDDQDLRAGLTDMKRETGWAQVGGRVLMDEDGKVTGRTSWIPNEQWWQDRPKGLNEDQVHSAVDKALAGTKLNGREQKIVDFMTEVHDERVARAQTHQELAEAVPDLAEQPHPAADLTVLASRAGEHDANAAAAVLDTWNDDHPATIARVQNELERIIGRGHETLKLEAQTAGPEEPAKAARAPAALDLFGQDRSREQALADEQRRRDAARSPNRDVSVETGNPADLFSQARKQVDLTDEPSTLRNQADRQVAESADGIAKNDIVRINKVGHLEHGNRARVRSIFRHEDSQPWTFRVGHEAGGEETFESRELKPSGQSDFLKELEAAREKTNTAPTEGQKGAGNYRKGRLDFGGMEVAIENPKGTKRSGKSASGKAWESTLHHDYGYFTGSHASDKEGVDVFLTGKADTGKMYVINQVHPQTGKYDEAKVVAGAASPAEAERTYRANYPKGWKGLGSMAEMSTAQFKDWLYSDDTHKPVRTQVDRRGDPAQRAKVSEMSPEQLRKALLTNDSTGIPNRRAYIESDKLPAQVSIDVDSLKWINDNMGHESGDALLKAVAESLAGHSDNVFHLSGDEFALQALHEREAHQVMAKVAAHLKDASIEVEMPDGKVVTVKGVGVSYGVGKDLREADAALQSHKSRREAEGSRAARGEAPPGATVRPGETGRQDQTGRAAEAVEPRFSRTASPEFKRWFGESKVTDKTGAPLRVFHGTNQAVENFDAARLGMMSKAVSANEGFFFTDSPDVAGEYAEAAGKRVRTDIGGYERRTQELQQAVDRAEKAAHRTGNWEPYERAMEAWENHDIATMRADPIEGQNLVPAYLKMENPLVHDFEGDSPSAGDVADLLKTARSTGHDGVIMQRVVDSPKGTVSNHYVVFDPQQVRSSITLSRRTDGSHTGLPRHQVERTVRNAVRDAGLRAAPNFPHVEVHQDARTLPANIRAKVYADGAQNTTGAVYDPTTGRIHLIAANNGTEREVQENLWHEAVGHHGLRLVMDRTRYNAVMDAIAKDMPERVQTTAYRNGLDIKDLAQRRVAAEEVIAYAAGQHLSGQAIDKPLLPYWTRAVRAVKAFFGKVTGKPFMDDKAISGLIEESRRALEEPGRSFTEAGEAVQSTRAPTFYSATERAITESKQAKASPDQWLATLKKTAGVKPEELEWLNLEPWLKAHTGSVTREELADYVRANHLEVKDALYGSLPQHGLSDEDRDLINERLEAGGHDPLTPEQNHLLTQGGEEAAGFLDDLEARVGIRTNDMRARGQSEAEREKVRLQERLHAMGHSVHYDAAGHMDTIRLDQPNGDSWVYHLHEDEDGAQLPASVKDLVLRLDEANEKVIADREARRGDPDFAEIAGHPRDTQYGDYTLPGGENYRELMMTLPQKEEERQPSPAGADLEDFRLGGRQPISAAFHSSHFSEPNIVAHTRFKDRTSPDGKKVLFLEELQSDWHQAGRRQGYRDPVTPDSEQRYAAARNRVEVAKSEARRVLPKNDNFGFESANEALQAIRSHDDWEERWPPDAEDIPIFREYAEASRTVRALSPSSREKKVPDAPFKTTWPMLAMKRMIRWAAEHGHDRIAWTTGDQQNERYNLFNHIDSIHYSMDAEGKWWTYVSRHGRQAGNDLQHDGMTEAQLREMFGDEITQKMLNGEGTVRSGNPGDRLAERELSGLDLKIGGEGMRGFYDNILPREVGKLIKKYGGKVGQTEIDASPVSSAERQDFIENGGPTGATAVHSFDITPEMRQQALSEGFPLFSRRQSEMDLPEPKEKGKYAAIRRAVDTVVNNPVTKDLRRLINPTAMDQESKRVAQIARSALGKLAHETQQSQEALEQYSRIIEKLPPEAQLTMMDEIEHGVPQTNADLQPVADGIRGMLDEWRDKVRGLGGGYLDNFIENYFPHYWQREDEAQRLVASIMGRRPLRGPASFLKMRTIPTIKEGMDAGLKPLTINPLIMSLLKTREMQRFVTGVTLMRRFKEDGLAKFLPSGRQMPDGWAPINDSSAKVKSWSEEEAGFIERGQYVMPENAARVINNHLSGSALKNFAPARIVRVGSNMLNSMQLGFSAFHLGFTTLDAIISKNALAIERAARGNFGGALKAFAEAATGPGAAIMNIKRGHDLLRAYTNPAGATPALAELVRSLEQAGGRAHMDRYYQAAQGVSPFRGTGLRSLSSDVIQGLKGPEKAAAVGAALKDFATMFPVKVYRDIQATLKTFPALEVPFELAGRVVRMSTAWIMEHLVPMQKLGVFSDLARDHINAHPEQTPEERTAAMQRIWDSVDNRLGEMVYDNLFWNRTMKDSLHLAIRAVGWNVGTIREIGGAPFDALRMIDKGVRTGKITAEDLGHRIPYVIAMTMTTAFYAAALNYMMTGEGPQELKDYFFPRTGGVTNYGTPQRVSLPSYVKDVYEYSQRPGTTVLNKLNPLFSLSSQVWENADYFGNPISDPDAGSLTQFGQNLKFVGKELTPFSLQGRQQLEGSEKPGLAGQMRKILPSVGITPAPGYITSPDEMERRDRLEKEKKYASNLKYQLKKAIAAKDKDAIARLKSQYIESQTHMHGTQSQVNQDKGAAAKKRRANAISMRQAGYPATADLVASLPLEPDAAARQFFAEQAEQQVA